MAKESEDGPLPIVAGELMRMVGGAGGGLPGVLLGPAGAALSRLLGRGIDLIGETAVGVPVEYIKGITQRQSDAREARSKITAALAEKAAALAVADDDLPRRALDGWLSGIIRAQENVEAIAQKTFEQIKDDPIPKEQTSGPSDDRMNVFSRNAEYASSVGLRDMFAKVLAGEIRRPGTISLQTLQFISILDQDTAQALAEALPFAVNGLMLCMDFNEGKNYSRGRLLQDAGIISQLQPDAKTTYTFSSPTYSGAIAIGKNISIHVTGDEGKKAAISGVALSRAARDLMDVLWITPNNDVITSVVEQLKGTGVVASILKYQINTPAAFLWQRSEAS